MHVLLGVHHSLGNGCSVQMAFSTHGVELLEATWIYWFWNTASCAANARWYAGRSVARTM